MKLKHGYVNLTELTIKIQFNINSTCILEKIPPFNYTYYERESLGNGWYGQNKEPIHKRQENSYLVYNNNVIIGYIVTNTNGIAYLQGKNSNKYIKKYIKSKTNLL